MHIHAPHNVAVTSKATAPTGPVSSSRLLLPAASWTLAAGSPLTAREAHDTGLLAFFLQILLIFAIFPLGHALMVMASCVVPAYPMRIAHIERLHAFGSAEVDYLPCALMPQVAHSPFLLAAFAFPGVVQAPPALGALLAPCLQAGELPQRLVVLPFEAADAAADDDESLAARGRHRCLVDLA